MLFIYVLDGALAKLRQLEDASVSFVRYEQGVNGSFTFAIVMVKKSWKPKVVPNKLVTSFPIERRVEFESSTY